MSWGPGGRVLNTVVREAPSAGSQDLQEHFFRVREALTWVTDQLG